MSAAEAIGQGDCALTQAVFALGRDVFEERSVKFREGSAEGDRVLMGVRRERGDAGLRGAVAGLCARLGLAGGARDEIDLRFGDAHMVHFGREGRGAGAVLKVYLEFPAPPADMPALRFIAWKWVPGGAPVRAFYRRVGVADAAGARAALDRFEVDCAVRSGANAILEAAARRIGHGKLWLLSVEDEGTPRASFDLNVYDAGLTIDEIDRPLDAALAALGHPPGAHGFPGDARLGHLSAGLGRDGRPFLTVYAGAVLHRAGS